MTQPDGKYANVSFQHNPNYVTTSNYCAGAYWGKSAEITLKGKAPGTFDAIVTIDVHRKAGVPDSSYTEFSLYCKVTVVKKGASKTQNSAPKKIALEKITLNKSSVTTEAGETTTLSVSYYPANTTDSKAVNWTSSNNGIVTVSGGKVQAKKAGTATITAKVGSKTATCKVTVKAAAQKKNTSKSTTSKDYYKNVSDAYKILNTFRTTKSNQWYWNSNNTAKVKTSGLKAVKKDAALEKIAKVRAKEQWIMYYERGKVTHDRPNGKECWTAYAAGSNPCGENLAWGQTTSKEVITDPARGWAETNDDYFGQGHRRNMLSNQATRVGIACYEKDGKTCWAMCLGY